LRLAQLVFHVQPFGDVLQGNQQVRLNVPIQTPRLKPAPSGFSRARAEFGLQVADRPFGLEGLEDFPPGFRPGNSFHPAGAAPEFLRV